MNEILNGNKGWLAETSDRDTGLRPSPTERARPLAAKTLLYLKMASPKSSHGLSSGAQHDSCNASRLSRSIACLKTTFRTSPAMRQAAIRDSSLPTSQAADGIVHFWRDPALPFFEGRRATGSLSCYAPHTHPTFSIGIVDAGHSVFSFGKGQSQQTISLQPGDVVLVDAGEVHSCNPQELQSWSYRMFHLEQAWMQGLAAEFSGADQSKPVRLRSQVLRLPAAADVLDRLTATLDADCEPLQKESEIIACLHRLVEICLTHAAPARRQAEQAEHQADSAGAPPAAKIGGLQRAREHLQHHCCERVTIDTLAQLAGLGPYQLIRQFSRHFGLTPHALQLDWRIHRARTLLQQGLPPAEVAHCTGFADQSHFHRAFKSRVAATPAQYRTAA
jgi:AraC-like DNA-binding protein